MGEPLGRTVAQGSFGSLNNSHVTNKCRRYTAAAKQQNECAMGREILLWLLGISTPIIILRALLFH